MRASSESLGMLWDISISSTTFCSSRSLVILASFRLLCRLWISLLLLFMSVSAACSLPWSSAHAGEETVRRLRAMHQIVDVIVVYILDTGHLGLRPAVSLSLR